MLPGQSCDWRMAIASSAIRRRGSPAWVVIWSMKKVISSGMSSRRSDSDGTRIGTTDRRWNRSSRKAPSAIRLARSRALDEMMRTSTLTFAPSRRRG